MSPLHPPFQYTPSMFIDSTWHFRVEDLAFNILGLGNWPKSDNNHKSAPRRMLVY